MEQVEQGVAVRKVAFDGQGTSGHDDRNHGFPAGPGRRKQPALRAGEVQVRERVCLPGEDGLLTQKNHYGIGRRAAAVTCANSAEERSRLYFNPGT